MQGSGRCWIQRSSPHSSQPTQPQTEPQTLLISEICFDPKYETIQGQGEALARVKRSSLRKTDTVPAPATSSWGLWEQGGPLGAGISPSQGTDPGWRCGWFRDLKCTSALGCSWSSVPSEPGCEGALIPFLSSFPHQPTGTAIPYLSIPGLGSPTHGIPKAHGIHSPEQISPNLGAQGSLGQVHWTLRILKSSEKASLCFQHTEASPNFK